jgi:hypothetical protein
MRKIFLIFGFILATVYAQAQKTGKDSTSSVKKNELLLEVKSPTLNTYLNNDNFGIMYRRNYNKVSLRLKLDGSYGSRYNPHYNINYNGDILSHHQYYIKSSIGIQKNVPITNYCQFYWGGDLFYANGYTAIQDTASKGSSSINSIGLSPFVGLKFSLGNRLSLGVENSGNLSYNNYLRKRMFNDPSILDYRSYKESFSFRPSNGIRLYLGIRF